MSQQIRTFFRRMGLGRLAYRFVRAPVNRILQVVSEGGPLEQRRTAAGRAEMEAAARRLATLPEYGSPHLELNLLTGKNYWYQTAFCLWTFANAARRNLAPVIFDDGSLAEDHRMPIQRLFPKARFVSAGDITANLDANLPVGRFPSLRARRLNFALLRKITDIHAGRVGWHLFIDSDLLFFHSPEFLLDWLESPKVPLRAMDVVNAYGYPFPLLNELAGKPVDELINTGLLGLDSGSIDWDRMEYWCRTLIERAGPHYLQEQALVALYLAGRKSVIAPISDYVTLPRPPEALECRAVMHHYVAHSKRWYFQRNWRRAIGAD